MANLTKSYETVFVLSNKLTEDATAELVKKFTDLIAANGTIDSVVGQAQTGLRNRLRAGRLLCSRQLHCSPRVPCRAGSYLQDH